MSTRIDIAIDGAIQSDVGRWGDPMGIDANNFGKNDASTMPNLVIRVKKEM